uniref:Uncharacterized protein n=1 Tax=Amphimedon queenslandica TaxID=400682 RepID=A0A1X7TEW4_AMPQE
CLPVGRIKLSFIYLNKDKRRETIRDRAAGSLNVFSPDVVLPDLLSTAALNE